MAPMTSITIGRGAAIPSRYVNRHGLVTGPTGTGKTVSLQKLIEGLSEAGIPVFAADVKGDLAALARSCPARLLDVYGEQGQPFRVPLHAIGADLLARAMELSDVQAGCLEIVFAFAAARNMPLDTIGQMRTALAATMANREAVNVQFGLVAPVSIGAIQRALLRLETQGAGRFFGSPGFDIGTLLHPSTVSILAADRLLMSPRLYSALLLWLLRELFVRLPEVGDQPTPRLVFVFDEAHTIFSDCPPALLRQIEQTVRLIRSKGVGVFFASQSTADIPTIVREQLSTRIEHERDLGVGRARFATVNDQGMPKAPVIVRPDLPACPLGALSADERAAVIARNVQELEGHGNLPCRVANSNLRFPWGAPSLWITLALSLVGFTGIYSGRAVLLGCLLVLAAAVAGAAFEERWKKGRL